MVSKKIVQTKLDYGYFLYVRILYGKLQHGNITLKYRGMCTEATTERQMQVLIISVDKRNSRCNFQIKRNSACDRMRKEH